MPACLDLERLYDEHAQALFAFLFNLTRNDVDTRDLLQEIFVRLAKQPALLKEARNERAFLIRMAHNLAIDAMRRRATRDRYYERAGEESPFIFVGTLDIDERAF